MICRQFVLGEILFLVFAFSTCSENQLHSILLSLSKISSDPASCVWKNRFSLNTKAPLRVWIMTSWLRAQSDNWSKLLPSSPELAVAECYMMPGCCEWAAEIPHSQIPVALCSFFLHSFACQPQQGKQTWKTVRIKCVVALQQGLFRPAGWVQAQGFRQVSAYSISAHPVMNHSEPANE